MKKLILLFSFLSVLFFSCATTDMASFKDPAFTGKPFKKIVVFFLYSDLVVRKNVEETVADAFFSFSNCEAGSSLMYFSPTKNYKAEDFVQTFKDYKIDGIMIISLTDYSQTQDYVSQQSTSKTKGTLSTFGDYWQLKTETTTQNSGGYYINKPHVKTETALFSVETGTMAWIGSGTTDGNAYAGVGTLAESLGNNIVDELQSYGLIK